MQEILKMCVMTLGIPLKGMTTVVAFALPDVGKALPEHTMGTAAPELQRKIRCVLVRRGRKNRLAALKRIGLH